MTEMATSRGSLLAVLRIQGVLVAIALCAGLSIALVHEWTRPLVAAQRSGLLGDAALQVMPGAVSVRAYARASDGSLRVLDVGGRPEVFIGLNGEGRPVGAAIVGSGQGYADIIQLVVGVDRAAQGLTGMRVVASRETPGLGSKIVDDKVWVESFGRIRLLYNEQQQLQALQVRERARPANGEVDAISGATTSVQSVTRIINTQLNDWLPLLKQEFDALEGGGRG